MDYLNRKTCYCLLDHKETTAVPKQPSRPETETRLLLPGKTLRCPIGPAFNASLYPSTKAFSRNTGQPSQKLCFAFL